MTAAAGRNAPPAKLRRGHVRDLDALIALERDFFTSDHQISRQSFRRFISSPKSALIVADAAGDVAGCALVSYRSNSRRARLYTIAVGAAFQRRGIARQLLAAAERAARRHGCRTVYLEVRADDAGALALYQSSGYDLFGRRKRYYGGRIDALQLEKPLAEPVRRRAVST